MEISKMQYEYALNRIEELLPTVTDATPATDANAIELTIVSDIVEAYEKLHYPIEKPTEPTLRMARALYTILGIAPAAMLGM